MKINLTKIPYVIQILIVFGLVLLSFAGKQKHSELQEKTVDIVTTERQIAYSPESIDSLYAVFFNISGFNMLSSAKNYLNVQFNDTVFVISNIDFNSEDLMSEEIATVMSSGKSAIWRSNGKPVEYSDTVPLQCSAFGSYDFSSDESQTVHLLKAIIRNGFITETTRVEISLPWAGLFSKKRASDFLLTHEATELSLVFDCQYSGANLDSCISMLLEARAKQPNVTEYKMFTPYQFPEKKEGEVYFETHVEFKEVDFAMVDSIISTTNNDTIYLLSSYYTEGGDPLYNTYFSSNSSSRTLEFRFSEKGYYHGEYWDSTYVFVHDRILPFVLNPEMSVSECFITTAREFDLGAKFVIENDSIRTGTLYYLMFIPKRL